MFFKSELKRTLDNADELNSSEKKMVAKFIDVETKYFAVDGNLKERLNQATLNRQNSISSLEEKDPDWIKWALIESYYISVSKNKEADTMKVLNWVCDNR